MSRSVSNIANENEPLLSKHIAAGKPRSRVHGIQLHIKKRSIDRTDQTREVINSTISVAPGLEAVQTTGNTVNLNSNNTAASERNNGNPISDANRCGLYDLDDPGLDKALAAVGCQFLIFSRFILVHTGKLGLNYRQYPTSVWISFFVLLLSMIVWYNLDSEDPRTRKNNQKLWGLVTALSTLVVMQLN
jgi:hypothetical protein